MRIARALRLGGQRGRFFDLNLIYRCLSSPAFESQGEAKWRIIRITRGCEKLGDGYASISMDFGQMMWSAVTNR